MSSKWSVAEVVRDHYGTFVDATTGRTRVRDYLGMVAAPIAVGAFVVWRRVTLGGSEALVSGVGVFTAALFALLIQVFPLAQRLTDDPRLQGMRNLGRLVDELEANLSYSVVVGMIATGALMWSASITDVSSTQAVWGTAGLAALVVHLILTAMMALKRTRAVYRRMRGQG